MRYLALKVPDPGLARVVLDNPPERIFRDHELVGPQRIRFNFFWDQVFPRNVHFLVLRIPRQLEHLHAVAQRRRNGLELVRRGDEHDLREVEGYVEIVVPEILILLRIEHFKER